MRRLFCGMLCLLLLLVPLSGCQNNSQNRIPLIRVGITAANASDTFISLLLKDVQKYFREIERHGSFSISVQTEDAKGRQSEQNAHIDSFIAQDYDVICVNMVDPTAASVLIDKAQKADIPTIFFNREPVWEDMNKWEKVFYVGADSQQAGQLQGEIVLDAYLGNLPALDKNEDGKIQYVRLEGDLGNVDTLLRSEFSVLTINKAGLEMDKLASDSADWQRSVAKDKMALWLEAYGSRIELVLANNDDMALGAVDAIDAYNGDIPTTMIPVVGVDATPAALTAVRNGKLLGTVNNNQDTQARTIAYLSYTLSTTGQTKGIYEKYTLVDYEKVNTNNVADYLEKNAPFPVGGLI